MKPRMDTWVDLDVVKAVRIVRDVQLQVLHHLGGDPPGAGLEARELVLVEDQAVDVVLLQAPGAGRAAWSAADDEDVCLDHELFPLCGPHK